MRGALGPALVLAVFALVNATAALAASALAGFLRGRVGALDARRRGDLWLVLRLFPAAAALCAAVLVAAAFAGYEPREADETLGPVLVALAVAGGLLLAASGRRVLRSRQATRRFLAERRRGARALALREAPAPVLCVRQAFPAVCLVGTRRPTLFVAERALLEFTRDELEVVLAHEGAHLRASDNLKTLLVAGAAFPFGLGTRIERDWRQAGEEDADARAAAGSSGRALSLASALLKVARMTPAKTRLALAATTLHRGEGLAGRVERLLSGAGSLGLPPEAAVPLHRRLWPWLASLAAAFPFLLPAVHGALEAMVRVLS